MANFEEIIKKHTGEDGNISAEAITALSKAIATAVGNEFVEKSRYKAKLDEIDTLKSEKQTAEDNATTAGKWKTKYDALKDEFDSYKDEAAKKETHASKEKAYRELLKQAGISDKRVDTVIKCSDIDGLELDDKGAIKDADKHTENIKTEWADFITTTTTKGANTTTPPNNTGDKMTREEIDNIKDTAARQKAMAENLSLYGIN